MTSIGRMASIDDLRARARIRMPRFAFDWLDGGAESESGLARNREAFDRIRLQPRYLRDVSRISHRVTLFGRSYRAPLGIAPMGFCDLAWPGADLMLARLARAREIPIIASTAASTRLETIAEAADGFGWFQLYVSPEDRVTDALMDRAHAAGYEVLVVTVDVSFPGKRDRDIRHAVSIPFRPAPAVIADLALHLGWALATLRAGAPRFANLEGEGFDTSRPLSVQEQQDLLITRRLDWDAVARIRDRWLGKLLLKGILHPADAVQAVADGCDGIIVSNHGGRQADYAPASIEALPAISKAVTGRIPVMLDSGIRRGADLVRAKALGADLCFAGRAFAFGAAAGGMAGVERAYEILEQELVACLGQTGATDFAAIGPDILWLSGPVA